MKRLLKRHWPLLGLVGLLGVIAAYFLSRPGSGERFVQSVELDPGGGVKLEEIHYTQNDPERQMKWVLDAAVVRVAKDNSVIFFDRFSLRVELGGHPGFGLKGNKGSYSRGTGEINVWGDLEGYSDDGYRLYGEHMLFKEKELVVTTNESVRILGPALLLEGRGLHYDIARRSLKILADVVTVVRQRVESL